MKNTILKISILFVVMLATVIPSFAGSVALTNGAITPKPLETVEKNGKGEVKFTIVVNSSLSEGPIPAMSSSHPGTPNLKLIVELTKVKPQNNNASRISGTIKEYFNVTYKPNTNNLIFDQKKDIPALGAVTVIIPVYVTENSTLLELNGFKAKLSATDVDTRTDAEISEYTQTVHSVCGNNVVEAGEECDDTNDASCSKYCTLIVKCGNNKVEAGEACDDGNTLSNDGCSSGCKFEKNEGPCKSNNDCESNICESKSKTCVEKYVASCGNGTIDAGETCDDGNTKNDDGCDSKCQVEVTLCGNGIKDPGEGCDDGNIINGDECNSVCKIETIEDNDTVNEFSCTKNNDCASDFCDENICKNKPAPENLCLEQTSRPEARDDNATVNSVENSDINVQSNDIARESAISKKSTRIIDAEGNEVTTLTKEGQGTWTVNEATGMIHFAPADVCDGSGNIQYTVKDDCGKTSNVANLYKPLHRLVKQYFQLIEN